MNIDDIIDKWLAEREASRAKYGLDEYQVPWKEELPGLLRDAKISDDHVGWLLGGSSARGEKLARRHVRAITL